MLGVKPLHPPLTLAAANAMMFGAAFIVFWILAKLFQLRWRERHMLLLGGWALVAGLALELTRSALPLILVGFVALVIAAWAIALDKETRRRQRHRRA
jgi:uncharacterized integral membrane protein